MQMTLEQKARYFAYENGLGDLVDATRAARERSEPNISTQVQGGLIRVVRTVYSKRNSTVTALTGWIEIADAVTFINSL